MRVIETASCVALVIAVIAATSRSDTASPTVGVDAPPEAISGSPTTPQPGSERERHDPFTPYDPGAPEAVVTYDSLTAAEQQVADRGRTQDFTTVHDGYGAAVQRRASQARAEAALILLGLDPHDVEAP